MRIAIFGTGGTGGYFGAQLARAGEDVVFIARGSFQAIRAQGLRVETPGARLSLGPARQQTTPRRGGGRCGDPRCEDMAGDRSGTSHAANDRAGDLRGAPTKRGGGTYPARGSVGVGHVLGGLCGTMSWIVAPGHIRSIGEAHFIKFGELDKRQANGRNDFDKSLSGPG